MIRLKLKYLIAALLFPAATVFAQEINTGKSFAPVDKSPAAPSATAAPETRSFFNTEKKDDSPITSSTPLNMTPNRNFVNPNDQYKKRLDAIANGTKEVRKKQSLGTVRTKNEWVTVRYRDSQSVDGDEIRISRNDVVIAKRLTLAGGYQGVPLRLEDGYNYIDFTILDTGEGGPATGEYEVIDRDGNVLLSVFWNMEQSDTASLVVIRQK